MPLIVDNTNDTSEYQDKKDVQVGSLELTAIRSTKFQGVCQR